MDPSDSQQPPQSSGSQSNASNAQSAVPKPPGCDVKPRLTKDQHDVLEQHFQQQHKPSTNVKKEFAARLNVPLDKINNWFQNRRAKVKQDRKKMLNQYAMQVGVGMPYGQNMNVMPGQFAHSQEHLHQPYSQLPMHHPDYLPVSADISSGNLSGQTLGEQAALELGPQISLQQQYDMHNSLRSIPEADRSASYHPDTLMQTIWAATNGAMMHNSGMPTHSQDSGFGYDTTGLPLTDNFSSDLSFAGNSSMTGDLAPSHPAFNFGDLGIDYSSIGMANTSNGGPADNQQSTTSISSEPSPFSGGQSSTATQSPNGPAAASVASITSLYTGWTEPQDKLAQTKQEDDTDEPFVTPYLMNQASNSEHALPLWGQEGRSHMFSQGQFYQQPNASAQAVLSSPSHIQARKLSGSTTDYDYPPVFHEDAFARRSSSTSNLASNMDAIHIRNGTPDEFKQPSQFSSIAARRQKRPVNLSTTAMRSSSYSAPMPSPGAPNDHTLRRIRSSGIPNVGGRIQKSQPGSAQRSPMALSFSEAAASPKFARTFSSSSSTTTVNQGGSLAPPTPLTPQDFGSGWQGGTVIRPHSVMTEHNSPESLHTNWSADPGNGVVKNSSPPTMSADLQARLANDALYRDTPPQSAPATQQSFPTTAFMQQPQLRAGFHSTTDLTLQQPKPNHWRRPSLPDTAQNQGDEANMQYFQNGGINYDDISLNGIHHNVPFAPPISSMPDFLVHQYTPPTDAHGNPLRRAADMPTKSFIFANQGPSDFRA